MVFRKRDIDFENPICIKARASVNQFEYCFLKSGIKMSTKTLVRCVLCQANLNLKSGNLDKFKSHLDNFHEAAFDIDLIISLSFLETEEKKKIVSSVFPQIRKFFADMSSGEQKPKVLLAIEKKLEEEGVIEEIPASRERARSKRENESKYESLKEDFQPMRKKVKVEDQNESRIRIENVESKHQKTGDNEPGDYTTTGKSPDNIDITETVCEENEKEEQSPSKLINSGESACDICGKGMLIKSIRRHKQGIHQLYDDNKANDSVATSDTSVEEEAPDIIEPVEEVTVNFVDPNISKVQNKNPKNVNCEVCNKCIYKKNLSRHMKTVHPRSEGIDLTEYDTSQFDPSFFLNLTIEEEDDTSNLAVQTEAFISNLRSHPFNESDIEVEGDIKPDFNKELRVAKVKCPDCNKKISRRNLRRHVRSMHSDVRVRTRMLNDSNVQTKKSVTEEASENDKASDEAVVVELKCKNCPAKFEDKKKLAKHFKYVHEIDVEDVEE